MFDLDGTVLDTMAHHWAAWRQLSQEFGFELTVAKLLALAGKPSTAIMELLCEEQVGGGCSLVAREVVRLVAREVVR